MLVLWWLLGILSLVTSVSAAQVWMLLGHRTLRCKQALRLTLQLGFSDSRCEGFAFQETTRHRNGTAQPRHTNGPVLLQRVAPATLPTMIHPLPQMVLGQLARPFR